MKKLREENDNVNEFYDDARSFSDSTATSDSLHDNKSKWHSAEELRKVVHIRISEDAPSS